MVWCNIIIIMIDYSTIYFILLLLYIYKLTHYFLSFNHSFPRFFAFNHFLTHLFIFHGITYTTSVLMYMFVRIIMLQKNDQLHEIIMNEWMNDIREINTAQIDDYMPDCFYIYEWMNELWIFKYTQYQTTLLFFQLLLLLLLLTPTLLSKQK